MYSKIQIHFQANLPNTAYNLHCGVWRYLLSNYDRTKGLSWFYNLLQNYSIFTKTSNMLNWERDLGSIHTPEEWKDAIRTCYRYSHCTNHWDLMMKILHRSYLTPLRMSLIFPSESRSCCKQCEARGNIYHILWDCKSIRSFWYAVFKLISSITVFFL